MKKLLFCALGAMTMMACTQTAKTSQEMTPAELVKDMGVGWNLGNSLDAKGEDETAWFNPVTKKELIDAIKAKGFKTLRVPTTWQYHIGDAPEYAIEKAWLDRVEEVVNYGLENDMYVILNIHHDEEWLTPTYEKAPGAKAQLAKVWEQIAARFKDYDHKLIFETFNETRLKGSPEEWKGGTEEGRDCINQFHEVALNEIRKSGSYNADRKVMISTYAASATEVAVYGLKLPEDDNIIVSIHNYFPYAFCSKTGDLTEWGTEQDKLDLDAEFDRLVDCYISKGVPVVMGEWGNMDKDNLTARTAHASYYVNGCLKRGIAPVWWDNGQDDEYGIINRNTYEWIYPEIANAIIEEVNKMK